MAQTQLSPQIPALGAQPQPNQQMATSGQPGQQVNKYQLGPLDDRRKARWSAYLPEWLIGLALLPVGGIGALIWLYYVIEWQFTVIEFYRYGMIVHSIEPNLLGLSTKLVWYHEIEDMELKRDAIELASGNARLVLYLDSRKRAGGRIVAVKTKDRYGHAIEGGPEEKRLVIRSLRRASLMKVAHKNLAEAVFQRRYEIKGIWT